MTLTVHADLEQGTPEWLEVRRGVLTASTIGQLITPGRVEPSASQTARTLTAQLIAERITGRIEPVPVTHDMLIGTLEEPRARLAYEQHTGVEVEQVGFILLETEHLRLGYSPDGLVGDDGLIEIKSRRPKKQLRTILDGRVPLENMAQLQAGLFVTGREWIDYVSICGGMPLLVTRGKAAVYKVQPLRETPPLTPEQVAAVTDMGELRALWDAHTDARSRELISARVEELRGKESRNE